MPKGKTICNCGRSCDGDVCWKCKQKEKIKEKVWSSCRVCNKEFEQTRKAQGDNKRQGVLPICSSCRKNESSLRLKALRDSQTPEERVAWAIKARGMVKSDHSETVRKQWATIKADDVKYKKAKERLKGLAVKQWEIISEEDRNKRIKRFMSSHGKSRSIGSDSLKALLIENGIYDGFVSEEVFKGYIPDEINHELRLIIEYYGEVYHCNPKRFLDPNQYLSIIQRTVGEQWKRDRKRLGVFYKNNYSVIIVWEKDFHRDPKKEIERIRNEIVKKRSIVGIISEV